MPIWAEKRTKKIRNIYPSSMCIVQYSESIEVLLCVIFLFTDTGHTGMAKYIHGRVGHHTTYLTPHIYSNYTHRILRVTGGGEKKWCGVSAGVGDCVLCVSFGGAKKYYDSVCIHISAAKMCIH